MFGYGYQNGAVKDGGAAAGPVNSVAPVISGTAERGETLSSTTGTWSGVGTITYSRQWKRDGLDIFGATSTTYVLVEADDNTFVTCLVTATDSEGSRSKISNTLGPVLGLPLNLTASVLSGTATIGQILSTTDGTWQGKATITFAYQWRRDLANIGGATSNTYTLADADYQTTIDCVVTATNTFGSAAQDSNDSALIAGITPSISGIPTFAGTEQVGETLTATAASTLGRPIPSRTWKWQRSTNGTSGWADISGATSITYLLDAADENKYVRVVQIETNAVGSDSANSAASGQISNVPAFDADAQAFFDRVTAASGSLTTTEQDAVNTLVVQMKADGIWSTMKAIYPMVGASAAACAQNLVSASFTGSFSSGWTFASTGVTGNGTSSYMVTGFIPTTNFISLNNKSFGVYVNTNTNTGIEMGSLPATYTGDQLVSRISNISTTSNSNQAAVTVASADSRGFWVSSRGLSTAAFLYKNAANVLNVGASVSQHNQVMYIGARNVNGFAEVSSNKRIAFAFLGDFLSDANNSSFYTAVQAFQTTLSRQV